MTERLYDNGHRAEFSATVLDCIPEKNGFALRLDRTAFFPGGGGQAADCGNLGSLPVRGMREENGELWHLVDSPLPVGSTIEGRIDAEIRLRRMQNHSGEHIISGLLWHEHGLTNVGFHMGHEDVTLDLDGELTRDQLDRIEQMANGIVAQNLPITVHYPIPDQPDALEYRSKLDLRENVRIVSIGKEGAVDRCACCAPHVARTGEIGIIKLLDFIRYKGGIRIHMLCGLDALEDYRRRYHAVASIAASLSAKQHEVVEAVARLGDEIGAGKARQSALCSRLIELHLAALDGNADSPAVVFEPLFGANELRYLVNAAIAHTDTAIALSGSDEDGYTYVLGSRNDCRPLSAAMHEKLGGKGGGSAEMVRGKLPASRDMILRFFSPSTAQK